MRASATFSYFLSAFNSILETEIALMIGVCIYLSCRGRIDAGDTSAATAVENAATNRSTTDNTTNDDSTTASRDTGSGDFTESDSTPAGGDLSTSEGPSGEFPGADDHMAATDHGTGGDVSTSEGPSGEFPSADDRMAATDHRTVHQVIAATSTETTTSHRHQDGVGYFLP